MLHSCTRLILKCEVVYHQVPCSPYGPISRAINKHAINASIKHELKKRMKDTTRDRDLVAMFGHTEEFPWRWVLHELFDLKPLRI